jgi:hypothetical protein
MVKEMEKDDELPAALEHRNLRVPDPRSAASCRRDGVVTRIVHAQVPPKVEYHLTEWGRSLCPALDHLLTWAEKRPSPSSAGRIRPRSS